MRPDSEMLLARILDAPVGQVVTVLGEVLDCAVQLHVVEQNAVAPNQFVRKVEITARGLPVIKASVKFDSTVLPESVMGELLRKKRGVGTILNVNGIAATRRILNLHPSHGITSREYELIHDGAVWFTIFEEINLNSLGSVSGYAHVLI